MFLQYNDLMANDASVAGILGLFMAMFVFFAILFLVFYIYFSLTLMKTAKRLNVENAWLAWIPIANVYLMLKIAKMNPLFLLLLLGMIIPFVGFLFSIGFLIVITMAQWKICEARQKPGWWALLSLIPLFGIVWSFIMWGILAWGK